MLLDASVVSRSDLVRAPRHKEWWYVGWVDDSRTAYTSFHAIRLPPVDNVVFTVFDLAAGRPVVRSRKLFLTAPAGLDHTKLRADSRRGQVHYSGSSEAGWSLRFSDGGVGADVTIRPTAPPFIKKENQFAHQYSMVSSMHTAVRGSVRADGREYAFTDALGYADHCSGHLPRRTGWLALWLLVKGVKATGSGIDVPPATPAATPAATDHRTDSDGPPPYDLDHSVQARPGWSSGILGDEPSIPLPPIAAGWREATVRGSSCPDLRSRSGDAGGKVVELHPVLSA